MRRFFPQIAAASAPTPRASSRARMRLHRPPQPSTRALVDLAHELLDAHADTARLSIEEASDAEWDKHLAYLRDLQRAGREVLARSAVPPGR